jgi:hypothetical protein
VDYLLSDASKAQIMKSLALILQALAFLAYPGIVLQAVPPSDYAGRPYQDAVHFGIPQRIPGPVFCAYYDRGGEGVAYLGDVWLSNEGKPPYGAGHHHRQDSLHQPGKRVTEMGYLKSLQGKWSLVTGAVRGVEVHLSERALEQG